jgi:hypothetical protein
VSGGTRMTMSPGLSGRTAIALTLLALLIGVLGDALLRGTPWGVNVVIWGIAVGAALMFVVRRAPPSLLVVLLLGEACLAMFIWRDTGFLQFWAFMALLAALSLVTAHAAGVSLAYIRIRDGLIAAIESAVRAASQAGVLLSRDIPWERWTRDGRWQRAPATATGVLLAIPVILVFGGLLRSAEPQFAALTDRVFGWDFPTVVSHVALTGSLAWISAGYLHGLASRRPWMIEPPQMTGAPQLRLPHIGIPLGVLALMLLVFAGIQAEYLFGGAETVLRTTGLTVAEYARRGFFELVTVATLVLALLLATYAAIDRSSVTTVRGYRLLSALLIALVGVVMASALVRMRLYVQNFGLSEDRIYVTAFMMWVGAVLAWFAVTVLRERASRFAYGAVTAGFATILALGALNPHALIVRTNLARAAAGHELDAEYLSRLSADAVPTIVSAWPTLDASTRCELRRGTLRPWADRLRSDWRSWNLSRWRARRAVATLETPQCPDRRTDG